jgi:RND family efflux transporter MFP subunit
MKRTTLGIWILVLAGGVNFNCSSGQSKSETDLEKIPVEVMEVKLGELQQSLNYNGDIKAELEVKVFSKIPDRIEKYFVDEGQYIQKGAPIAQIFATTIEQGVRQAEAGLLAARAQEANLRVEFERAERLQKENVMSQQQYDLIRTQYEAVKAQLEQAEAALTSVRSQLKDATISAPMSGIIGKRYFENGDMANPAVPVVSIVKMDKVKITFDATEEDLGKLAVGQDAYVTVRSFPDRKFSGKVTRISPVLDPLTRMVDVEVLMDNPDKILKPGMYAEVEVITGTLTDVMVIPRLATIESTTMEDKNGGQQVVKNFYVFIVDSVAQKVSQKKLDVLYINHSRLAAKGGIRIGDKVVISGQNNLRDSSAVTIVTE